MTRRNVKQGHKKPIEEPAGEITLTVEYWRERFQIVQKRFENLTEIASLLCDDPDFSGTVGYLRLRNIQNNRGGLQLTAKAVHLLEELRPEKAETSSLLKRQKINIGK